MDIISRFREFFGGYEITGTIEHLIVGLGNPGGRYEDTRHNAGFMAVDYIAGRAGVTVNRLKFKSLCGDGALGGKRVLFLKPTTYMNLSGQAVCEAMDFYKIPQSNLLVISDDTSLPVGGLRIRRKGSDGGQKGLRNIIMLSGSDEFVRIRVGVGQKPYPDMDLSDWVLSRFTSQDQKLFCEILPKIHSATLQILSGDIDGAMKDANVRGQGSG